MKNGRHDNNNSKRSAAGKFAAKSTGSESSDIERTTSGIIETDTREIESIRIEPSDVITNDSKPIGDNKSFTLPTGYYFTPSGDVERIPDGHYLNNGRLRKRRIRRDSSNSADGNEDRDRTETSEQEKYLGEIPLRIESKTRRAAKKLNAEKAKLTMVAMIATGCSAIFTSVSLLTKHDHWQLAIEEAQHLSQALNDAIETLPTKYYAQITQIIERWIPWINLSFVVGAIIIPRLEESAKRVEARNYKATPGSNTGNARTETNPIDVNSSAFWNH